MSAARSRRDKSAREKGPSFEAREARDAEERWDDARRDVAAAAAIYFGGAPDRIEARRGYHEALERQDEAASRLAEAASRLAKAERSPGGRASAVAPARRPPAAGDIQGEIHEGAGSEG